MFDCKYEIIMRPRGCLPITDSHSIGVVLFFFAGLSKVQST